MIRIALALMLLCQTIYQDQHVVVFESFAAKPFQFELTPVGLQSKFENLTLYKKIVKNKYTEENDTLLVYKVSNYDEFFFLKTKESTFFEKAMIKSPSVRLSNNVCIGMLKSTFFHAFNIQDKTLAAKNVFVITDKYEFSHHYFYFEKNELVKISVNMRID